MFLLELAERSGVAREFFLFDFSHECPQKNQPIRSSCLAGQREHIYMIVLFYYIDTAKDFKWRIFRDKQ